MSVPWWAFLMMPLMMLGMALTMWLMMQMMMGMDHRSQSGDTQVGGEQGTRPSESELDDLRRHVIEVQERLEAVGSQAPRSEEGEEH